MKQRFVVLTSRRSGSYFLGDLLDRQPAVTCHGELFKRNVVELRPAFRRGTGFDRHDVERRDAAPLAFLDLVVDESPGTHVGFKLFEYHNAAVLEYVLGDPNVKVIFLARNPVQCWVSWQLARATDQWTRRNRNEGRYDATIRFEWDEFCRYVTAQNAFYKRVTGCVDDKTGHRLLCIDYQDLGKQDVYDRVARFLGIGDWDHGTGSGYFKQLNKPYPQVVENWCDVENMCKQVGVDETMPFEAFVARWREANA